MCRAFSKEDICKWLLDLCKNRDSRTVSCALRGIRNMVLHEDYRSILAGAPDFVKILEHIEEIPGNVTHAQVYVFEIYHTLMNQDGRAPMQEEFLGKLLRQMNSELLSSEARLWGMQCIETCIRLFENRDSVIKTVLDEDAILKWLENSDESLLVKCLELVCTFLEHVDDEKALLASIVERSDIMDKLFGFLKCGLSNVETGILKLMHWMADVLPDTFHLKCLNNQWIKLQVVLEKAADENKQWVIDILHTLAVKVAPATEVMALSLPDSGLPFVKLLLGELTDEIFDIIHFMWSHYEGILPILSELELVALVLKTFMTSDWMLTTRNLDKIHLFFEAAINSGENPKADFEECLMSFLKSAFTAERDDYVALCLKIGLYLLVKLHIADKADLEWLLDEGLVDFAIEFMGNERCLHLLEDPFSLFYILKKILPALTEESAEIERVGIIKCQLFVATMNSAEVFGVDAIAELLTNIKHQVNNRILFVVIPDAVMEKGFSLTGLKVLHQLLESWTPEDSSEFLDTLLAVLLKGYLERCSEEDIKEACILISFAEVLYKIAAEDMTEQTTSAVLSCVAAAASRFNVLLSDVIVSTGSAAVANLWDLVMKSHGNSHLSVAEENAILMLLKNMSRLDAKTEKKATQPELHKVNAHLMSQIREKNGTIENLEGELRDAFSKIQELTNLITDNAPSCPEEKPQLPPSVVQLETTLKRLKRQIEDKEAFIATLNDRNHQLSMELKNRNEANTAMVELVDTQHTRIALLEEILESEGYHVVGDTVV